MHQNIELEVVSGLINMMFINDDTPDWEGTEQTAICSNYVMRSGKHYAKFTISCCDSDEIIRYFFCRLGIMRPISYIWKEEAEWTRFSA